MKKYIAIISLIGVLAFFGNVYSSEGRFYEQFNGNSLNNGFWDVVVGGNNITFEDGVATFAVEGADYFPWIQTKRNPFPENKDFVFEIRFAYPVSAIHGDGVYVQKDNIGMFGVKHDSNHPIHFPPHVPLTAALPWDSEFHVYTVEYIDGMYTHYVDGVMVYQRVSPDRPNTIFIGHPPRFDGAWTALSIDYIDIKPL